MRLLRAAPLGALFLLGFAVGLSAPARAQFACPANFQDQSAPITCTCSAEAVAAGSVWGSDVYTSDSSICRAARHAGIIPAEGGTVQVIPAPGMPSYAGTTANGVTSLSYGAWGASFTFRR